MKKFLFGSLLAGIAAVFSFVPALTFAQTNTSANGNNGVTSTTPFGPQETVGINVKSGSSCGNDTPALICGIKNLVNKALMFLGLIALLILIYAGFKMLTAGGDAKGYDEGFTILKHAAVGLAFIAASYIIVQFIMYVIGQFVI